MKSIGIFVLFLAIVLVEHTNAFNACSARKMWDSYNEMRRANCRNCDKYFHCMGNYNAVYACSGSMEDKKKTAERISNGREWAIFGGGGADSNADQRANQFGRNGGSCATVYLKAVRCAYNPSSKRCG